MELSSTECAVATATKTGDEEGRAVSKRQLKKMRRAQRDPAERQVKKHKSKQEAKSANRFQCATPKYSFANGNGGEGVVVYPFRGKKISMQQRKTNMSGLWWSLQGIEWSIHMCTSFAHLPKRGGTAASCWRFLSRNSGPIRQSIT